MENRYQVIVLGAGAAGLHAALETARQGLRTALVEADLPGGTAMRTGAVPVKRLMHICSEYRHASDFYRRYSKSASAENGAAASAENGTAASPENGAAGAPESGKAGPSTVGPEEAIGEVRRLLPGVERMVEERCSRNGVDLIRGGGRFESPRTFAVDGEKYRADYFIIATGSRPSGFGDIRLDGKRFISHRDLFHGDLLVSGQLPPLHRVIIVGGDVEGIEFAQALAELGSSVTVVEQLAEILPATDEDLKEPVLRRLEELGVRVLTGVKAEGGSSADTCEGGKAVLRLGDGTRLEADSVLVTGVRRPNFPEGLELTGVETGEDAISVDDRYRSSVAHIFAVGEINGRGGPANVAAAQGVVAAQEAARETAGQGSEVHGSAKEAAQELAKGAGDQDRGPDFDSLPLARIPYLAVFTIPEIAGAGYSEKALQKMGVGYKLRKMNLRDTWRGFSLGTEEGFVKLLYGSHKMGEKLLGIWWCGENAADMISGQAICAAGEAPGVSGRGALSRELYIHPSMAEVYRDLDILLDIKA